MKAKARISHPSDPSNATSQAAVNAAVTNALATRSWAARMCDQFVAAMYGQSSSGYATAIDNWDAIPAQYKSTRGTPPPGMLVFFHAPDQSAGHVAISIGGGAVVSTDYPRTGRVSVVKISTLESQWGLTFIGWSVPFFNGHVVKGIGKLLPGAGGSNDLVNTPAPSTAGLGSASGSTPSVGQFLGNIVSAVFWERVMLIIGGAALAVMGVVLIISASKDGIPA